MLNNTRITWLALAVFLIAFLPLAVPSRALQFDEVKHWHSRTDRFIESVTIADWRSTVQTEHPGITVVALGAVGQGIANLFGDYDALPFVEQIQVMRLPIGFVNALVLTLAFIAASRIFDRRVAFVAALFWVTEPYLRWYLRLLHVDGMSTTFMLLSFMLMLLAWRFHISREANTEPAAVTWWLVAVSAFVAGLAALTRFSSFYMVGIAGLMSLVNWFYYRTRITRARFIEWIAAPVIIYTIVIMLTWTALYPGMWVTPGEVWNETVHGVDNATSAHENGSYFRGEPVGDPGVWYYLIALPYRLAPWTLLGLPLALLAMFSSAMRNQWRVWLMVLLYAAVYLAMLVWQDKKFDRYAAPTWPALHLMAAFGWMWLAGFTARFIKSQRAQQVAWATVTVLLVGNSLWYLRNEYAYFSPLLGGGNDTTEHLLIIGSGEGLQGVEQFFDDDETCGAWLATFYDELVRHYDTCTEVHNIGAMGPEVTDNADYIVNYINYRQRRPQFQSPFEGVEPVHTVEVHGITYAEIYAAADINEKRRTAQ
ncbi:MAG: hypothetical protein AAF787_08335 [Chloroflexota bacterium]